MRLAFVLVAVLLTVGAASAMQIIGAADGSTDTYLLEQILDVARLEYGEDVVPVDVRSFDEITDEDLANNVVLFMQDGKLVISAPFGSEAETYLSFAESYVGDYVPFTVVSAGEVINGGIDEEFEEACVETGASIYLSDDATGSLNGGASATYQDLCVGNTLIEYRCEGDAVVREEYDCECSDGACVESNDVNETEENETDPTPLVLPGNETDGYWIWFDTKYVRANQSDPIPETCDGCMVGERCVDRGFVLPDGRVCSQIGVRCEGCYDDRCYAEGTVRAGEVCQNGVFVEELEEDEPLVPRADNQPVAEPEPRGFWQRIASFFSRLFGR